MEDKWKKIDHKKACDVMDTNYLDPGSSDLLDEEMRPEAFIRKLSEAKKWRDAVKVMAHILPRREAVWWACICARQMEDLTSDKMEILALEAAEKWVFKPTDKKRLNAFQLAQKSDSPSAGTMSAMAAVHSERTLQVAKGQKLELDSDAFPHIVAAIAMMSTSAAEESRVERQYRQILKSGEHIACGGNGQIEQQKD
jgi:hypothetical protein